MIFLSKKVKEDLEELSRWRSSWALYIRYLSEFPAIALTLQNLKDEVDNKLIDFCEPPCTKDGPFSINGLRYKLRYEDLLQNKESNS